MKCRIKVHPTGFFHVATGKCKILHVVPRTCLHDLAALEKMCSSETSWFFHVLRRTLMHRTLERTMNGRRYWDVSPSAFALPKSSLHSQKGGWSKNNLTRLSVTKVAQRPCGSSSSCLLFLSPRVRIKSEDHSEPWIMSLLSGLKYHWSIVVMTAPMTCSALH